MHAREKIRVNWGKNLSPMGFCNKPSERTGVDAGEGRRVSSSCMHNETARTLLNDRVLHPVQLSVHRTKRGFVDQGG